MTEEPGKGLRIPNSKTDATGRVRVSVLYRIAGTENIDGKELLKLEMHRAGVVTNTDLLSIDEHGIVCRPITDALQRARSRLARPGRAHVHAQPR